MHGVSARPSDSPAAAAPRAGGWRLEHSYAELPSLFHAAVPATAVRAPRVVVFNRALAEELGLDAAALNGEDGAAIFAGNTLPEGGRWLAQAYAGHQFGHFTALGDGRALLMGEQRTADGRLLDLQLKGSGPTPYSRRGDGRAALGPMLREYLVSEAMHAMGIPTTRSLAVAATGETVWRQEALPGAVLTRVAASHLRVGTFEWAAAHEDRDALRQLADYAIRRHYPALADAPDRHARFLAAVIARQAALVARWLHVGFVHGVMNTDNMAVSGETIDYGPCAFMDRHDPETVFSSIDHHGRYAYGNQATIAHWNLARFAEALLPLLAEVPEAALEVANDHIRAYPGIFAGEWLRGMRAKLGLVTEEPDDAALATDFLTAMQAAGADHTNTFRRLTNLDDEPFADEGLEGWRQRWRARLARQPQDPESVRSVMARANPVVIPRNHRVEAALAAATAGDMAPFHRLLRAVTHPWSESEAAPEDLEPGPSGVCYRTFCGT